MNHADIHPGDCVTWLYSPHGGYGYVIPVDAEVVRLTPKRVVVRVALWDGTLVERRVRAEMLRERQTK